MTGASMSKASGETSFFLKRPALEDDLVGKGNVMMYHLTQDA
jgi:hypothetical protein